MARPVEWINVTS